MDVIGLILNFVYFAVGLGVGVAGLYLTTRFSLAQQQDKFNHIAAELTKIRETLSAMAEVTSQHTIAREDRLFALASLQREKATEGVAALATVEIKSVVQEALSQAGVSDALDRTDKLESQLRQIVHRSNRRALTVGYRSEMDAERATERIFDTFSSWPIGEDFSAAQFAAAARVPLESATQFLDGAAGADVIAKHGEMYQVLT